MAFTRSAMFLKWSGDATARAFLVQQQDYQGGDEDKVASYARSLYDNSLLAVRATTTPRVFYGQVLGKDSTSGTSNDGVDDINNGTIDELKAAWAATDLKCKSFEDSAYWNAEWRGPWRIQLEFDPFRNYALVLISLEEKN